MDVKEENICRLCLTIAEKDFQVIDEIIRHMYEVLSLKVNLDVSKDPVICKNCRETLIKCFDFKSVCIDTEKIILSFADDSNGVTFQLQEVFKEEKNIETINDNFICRFCCKHLSDVVSLDTLKNDEKFANTLQAIMPDMNFDVVQNPVICASCIQHLQRYSKFAEKCLDVEVNITKYCENQGIAFSAQVILNDVVKFWFKNIVDSGNTKINVIKREEVALDHGANSEVRKAEEALDIKEHKVNSNNETAREIEISKSQNSSFKKNYMRNYIKNVLEHKRTFKCAICPFQAKHKGNFNSHMLIHKNITEVEMYKCHTCTYQSKHKSSLKTHALIHKNATDLDMYKCSTCTFQTRLKGNLKTHMLIHRNITEVEIHKCSECTYRSVRKGSLKNHMLIHKSATEVEMYKCATCTFQAKQKSNLKTHMLIHKDVKAVEIHKCSECDYQSIRKGNLKSHMSTHRRRDGGGNV